MNLDNIGPIALFIVYMAISTWFKQNKAKQKNKPAEKPVEKASDPISKPQQGVGGMLNQLKQELFEIDRESSVSPQIISDSEPEEETGTPASEPVLEQPQFVEGSQPHSYDSPSPIVVKIDEIVISGQSLEEVLEPYSTIEQGIILSEILGKPRARQENGEWFHRS